MINILGILSIVTRHIPIKCEGHSGLIPRLLALLIDLFICKIVAFLIILALSFFKILEVQDLLSRLYSFYLEVDGWKLVKLKDIYFSQDNLQYMAILFATFVFYSSFFKISSQRCTPGKSIFKIIVVNHDGVSLNMGQAMLRSSLIFISFLILPIGIISFLTALYSREKISLHDRICDTRVVKFYH